MGIRLKKKKGRTKQREERMGDEERRGLKWWGLCLMWVWEGGRAPWAAGGVSRRHPELGEFAGFAVTLEV